MKSSPTKEQYTSLHMPSDSKSSNVLSKSEYRECLLQQMATQKENKKREKESRLGVSITGSFDPEKEPSRLHNLGNPNNYGRTNMPRSPIVPTLNQNTVEPKKLTFMDDRKPIQNTVGAARLLNFDSLRIDSIEPPIYQMTNYGDEIVNSLSSILHRPHRITAGDTSLPSYAIAPITTTFSQEITQMSQPSVAGIRENVNPVGYHPSNYEVDKKKYNAELLSQMRDNNERKRRQVETEMRENIMTQMESENNSPWGKAGAGAPLRPPATRNMPDLLHTLPQPEVSPNTFRENPQFLDKSATQTNAYGEKTYARGGHSIFGTPKTDVEKLTTDRYRKELEKQMEDQKMAKRLEIEKLRAEEEREMRQIKEYNEKIQQREEEERRQQMEKERARVEKNQRELEMRRNLLEEKKKEAYKAEEIKTFTPPEISPPVQIVKPPVEKTHFEKVNREEVQMEKNKQNKILERLEAFRSQLNSKKNQFENLQMKKDDDEVIQPPVRPVSGMTIAGAQDYEILSDFWKISDLDDDYERVYYENFSRYEFEIDKEDKKGKDKRLVKKMKSLKEKIMGDRKYKNNSLYDDNTKDSIKLETDEEYSWLNPGTYDT